MSPRKTWRRIGREWLVALASYALLIAPFGCQFQSDLLDWSNWLSQTSPTTESGDQETPDDTSGTPTETPTENPTQTPAAPPVGLFINPDLNSNLMIAGRNSAGDAFFVFGQRKADGGIAAVDSVLTRTADGAESSIVFVSGMPTFLKGPNGSYILLSYTETSLTRLAGVATIYDAATGATQTVPVVIDLAQIRADVLAAARAGAAAIEALTGQHVNVPEVPTDGTAKTLQRAVPTWLLAITVLPLVGVAQFTIAYLSQVMAAVYTAVAVAMQAAIVAAFAPLFIFSRLLGEVGTRIDSVPLLEIFIELPGPPQIDIEFL